MSTPSVDKSYSTCLVTEAVGLRKRFLTLTRSEATRLPLVLRRITYDRDTAEPLADESIADTSTTQLSRLLDKPRRLRVEFHFQNDGTSTDYVLDNDRTCGNGVVARPPSAQKLANHRYHTCVHWTPDMDGTLDEPQISFLCCVLYYSLE